MRLIRKSNDGLRIVIVGGGYAGLATLVTLRERSSQCEIVLIDPRPDHIKVTQVHESFRRPTEPFRLPYHLIEKRFSIRHLQTPVALCDDAILSAQSESMIRLEDGSALPFDYLVLATGAGLQTTALDHSVNTLTLSDFLETSGPELLEAHLGHSKKNGLN